MPLFLSHVAVKIRGLCLVYIVYGAKTSTAFSTQYYLSESVELGNFSLLFHYDLFTSSTDRRSDLEALNYHLFSYFLSIIKQIAVVNVSTCCRIDRQSVIRPIGILIPKKKREKNEDNLFPDTN